MKVLTVGETKERDLSWFEWTIARDISPDGKWVLFEEEGEPVGPAYAVGLRKMDGSPPIRLGEGMAGGLSPDGKWAIAIRSGTPERFMLLPTGPGEPKEIHVAGIEHYGFGARFFPDGEYVIFNGSEPGHAMRTYVEDLQGGKPRPITPEGVVATVVTGLIVSPDGKYVAGWNAEGRLTIYPVDGGEPRPVPNLPQGFFSIRWAPDGLSLYVFRPSDVPTRIYRVVVATGKQELIREIKPAYTAGIVEILVAQLTPDSKSYVYSYRQVLSELYVVDGLK